MIIHSTDDLRKASQTDLRAAVSGLRLKERVLSRLAAMGRRESMTRAEYVAHVAAMKPHDCPTCGGAGVVAPPKPREIGVVHPSQAHKCRLKNYYDVTGELRAYEEIDWKFQATYAIGHAIHELVQAALSAELGDGFQPEASIDIAGFIRGNTDGDVWVPSAHAVLEIKTMGSEFDNLAKPKDEHVLQAVGMYATALDAPFVTFLYVSKAFPYPIKEFVVEYDPSIFRRWMRDKGDKILRALETGDPPVADAGPAECKECPYTRDCPQKVEKKGGTFSRPRR